MSSRSTAGALLFVVTVGALGAYSAYRFEVAHPGDTAPATPPSGLISQTPPAKAPDSAPPKAPDAASSTATETGASDAASAKQSGADASGSADATGSDAGAKTATTLATGTTETAAASGTDASAPAAADKDTKTVTTFELETPTYDVVRVEPTGEAVIAGRASPGATIELRANGQTIASTKANADGEWVITLDQPLKPGDYDIALHSDHENAKGPKQSSDRLAVSIPESGKETPLVALSRADQPVEILQKPEAEQKLAAAEPADGAAADKAAGASSETGAAAPVTTLAQTASPSGTEPAASDGSGTDESSAASTSVASSEPTGASGSDGTSAEAGQAGTPGPGEASPSAAGEGDDTVIARLVVGTETMSTLESSSEEGAQAGDKAGTSSPAGSAKTQDAAGTPGQASGQKPETDTTTASTGTGGAASGADQPQTASTSAAAGAQGGSGARTETASAGDAAPETAPVPPPAPSVPVTIDAAEVADGDHFVVQGTSEPGATIRLYLGDALLGSVRADDAGRWMFGLTKKLSPGHYQIRVDQVSGEGGEVIARAEVPFGYAGPRPEPAAVASSDAQPAPELEVVGSGVDGVHVMVRRGDALWTIARYFYGSGYRYTTIYRANDSQIRDPDLIYPGQVFVLPGVSKDEILSAQGG